MHKHTLGILPFIALTACNAPTPARQALIAHDLATAIVDSLSTAHQANLLTTGDLQQLAPAVDALLLAQHTLALSAHAHSPDFPNQLQALHEATLALLRAREAAIAKNARPSTKE